MFIRTTMSRICEVLEFVQLLILNDIMFDCSSTTVNIPQGKIRGLRNDSDNYKAYLGIPYASVVERFQEPGPAPHWHNTFHAINGSVYCQQTDRSTLKPTGQEDCLVLNIFTPITFHKPSFPVLIFIPGGGFHFGLNSDHLYNPKHLIKKDVIVVTINYRLGAFGFLCLQTPEVPGNVGLRDQLAAIRWVKNNIQYFGGDPQSITLFGQSVGAASVSYLLLSSQTEGLFQHVIIASGSLLVPYALDNDPVGTASRVASRMGYTTNDPDQLKKIYQNASSDDILKASYFNDINDPLALYVFKPCEEKSKDALIKTTPRELINSTQIKKDVSIVIGYNNMEGIKWAERYDDNGLKNLDNLFTKMIPFNIIFSSDEEKSMFVAEMKSFYFNSQSIDSYDPLIDYFSDAIIMYPLVETTNYFLSKNLSVYNYYFQYDSNRNMNKHKTKLAWVNGSTHTDDLNYIFDPLTLQSIPVTPTDAAIIDAMTSFWSNVAANGNPSTQKINWRTSAKNDLKFLSIDKNIEMIPLPNKERIRFWQEIYTKYKSY